MLNFPINSLVSGVSLDPIQCKVSCNQVLKRLCRRFSDIILEVLKEHRLIARADDQTPYDEKNEDESCETTSWQSVLPTAQENIAQIDGRRSDVPSVNEVLYFRWQQVDDLYGNKASE